jgi:hypothetical protein
LGGGLFGAGLDAVFLQEIRNVLVFVLKLQGGEVADHRGTDLVGELGAGVDLLLLRLELLLLVLDRQLTGLDVVLLFLEAALVALVAPVPNEEPKAEQQREPAAGDGGE